MDNFTAISSWSGGKDITLALYKCLNEGKKVHFLLNFAVDGKSHGLNREIIKSQAEAIGIPLIQRATTWENYEHDFDEEVLKLKEKSKCITGMIVGDIDLECHLDWIKKKSTDLCIEYYEPLWKRNREEILHEFVSEGFEAIVVNCAASAKFLPGRTINRETAENFIRDTKKAGICPCGENGEFHTLVIDGPLFKKKIEILESKIEETDTGKFGKKWILNIKKWRLKPKL